jgi:hypothetical protein
MEMVTEIASEAAQNANVGSMVHTQEQLVRSLYTTMVELIEEGDEDEDYEEDLDEEEEEEEEEEDDEDEATLTH